MTGDKGKKGFAGLDSMVSDIEVAEVEPPVVVEVLQHTPPSTSQKKVAKDVAQPAYRGNSSPVGGGGKERMVWIVVIGIIVIFLWVIGSNNSSPNTASVPASDSTPVAAPAQNFEPPYMEPSANANEPTENSVPPVEDGSEEEMPPEGNGLEFSRPQIHYCLSEDIRISAWKGQVNQESEGSVNAFNAAVNDYNLRCSNFRYRKGLLESVRTEVELNRNSLISQGVQRAAANP
jgi:hypothetical protein